MCVQIFGTDRRTDGQTDRRTDGQTDGQTEKFNTISRRFTGDNDQQRISSTLYVCNSLENISRHTDVSHTIRYRDVQTSKHVYELSS